MADENRPKQSSPDSAEKTVEKKQLDTSAVNQSDAIDRKSSEDKPKPLTPEEQMELYEKDLKENDWGHQPC
jgi:hypothetical protein